MWSSVKRTRGEFYRVIFEMGHRKQKVRKYTRRSLMTWRECMTRDEQWEKERKNDWTYGSMIMNGQNSKWKKSSRCVKRLADIGFLYNKPSIANLMHEATATQPIKICPSHRKRREKADPLAMSKNSCLPFALLPFPPQLLEIPSWQQRNRVWIRKLQTTHTSLNISARQTPFVSACKCRRENVEKLLVCIVKNEACWECLFSLEFWWCSIHALLLKRGAVTRETPHHY